MLDLLAWYKLKWVLSTMLSENFIHCCGSGELSSTINAVEFIFGSWIFSCTVEGVALSPQSSVCIFFVAGWLWLSSSGVGVALVGGGGGGSLIVLHGCNGCGLLLVLQAQEKKAHCKSSLLCQLFHLTLPEYLFLFSFLCGMLFVFAWVVDDSGNDCCWSSWWVPVLQRSFVHWSKHALYKVC